MSRREEWQELELVRQLVQPKLMMLLTEPVRLQSLLGSGPLSLLVQGPGSLPALEPPWSPPSGHRPTHPES
jgi:hypothetical protein